jgi:hypothetical protein
LSAISFFAISLFDGPITPPTPTDEEFDFIFDCATSITQNGKVEYYARIGEDVHPGTIINSDGTAVEGDATEALRKIRSEKLRSQLLAASVKLSADIRDTALL